MCFVPKDNNKKEIELKVKDMLIPSQSVTKFLGMWLDQTLSWHSHIQKLTLKIKRNKYLLNNGKHLIDQDTKKLVYYSHIASQIQYGLLLWGNNANKDQITRLQKLQTKCLQLVQSNQTKSNPNKNLGILTIDEMISLENMKFGYKLVHHTVNLNNLTIMDQIKTPPCRVELVRIKPISSVKLPTLQTSQDLLDLGEYFTRSKVKPKKCRRGRRPRSASTDIDYKEIAPSSDSDKKQKQKAE